MKVFQSILGTLVKGYLLSLTVLVAVAVAGGRAKLSQFISHDGWNFPTPVSIEICIICDGLGAVPVQERDGVEWVALRDIAVLPLR